MSASDAAGPVEDDEVRRKLTRILSVHTFVSLAIFFLGRCPFRLQEEEEARGAEEGRGGRRRRGRLRLFLRLLLCRRRDGRACLRLPRHLRLRRGR